jgi:cellulose synthase/poly-beta-1,6-N-acetylglucosamine synthase-like glycosyltransferase
LKKGLTPTVSILIAAYNEEKNIREKLENTIELDYPKDKLEIIVGSDGSNDRTVEIVAEYSKKGVKLLDFKKNRGKTAVQNDLVSTSRYDILVFTDAASFLRKDSLQNLVKSFSDKRVGAVAGCMKFASEKNNLTVQSQGLYWKYEMKLREAESIIGSLVGVDGPLYAVRREHYVPLASHIISDLMTPLLVLKQGKQVVLDKNAIVYEAPTTKSEQELKTRRRITLRGLVGIFSEPKLLSPFHFPLLAVQIFFHKLLRWTVGFLVIINFLICVFLSVDPFFKFVLAIYLAFFTAAVFGWGLERNGKSIALFKVPYYFCLVNLAAALGVIDFFKKKQAVSWKPVR